MRYKPVKKLPPKEGDHRTREGFLWFPKMIAGEYRWLEKATWEQVCEPQYSYDLEGAHRTLRWVNTRWK